MTRCSPGHREGQIRGSLHTKPLCLPCADTLISSPPTGVFDTPLHVGHPDQSVNENSGFHCLVTLSLLKTLEFHSSLETWPRKT